VCLYDQRTGEVHNYTRKTGVEYTALVFPKSVSFEREQLWNIAERAEKRKDARVAREFELSLPAELSPEQRRKLAANFAKSLVDKYGVAADVAVHQPSRKGDQRNHHAHILITTRQISAQGVGEKTDLEREDKALRAQGKASGREQIEALRADWATWCNTALERAGHQERVNHRSLEAQGIDRAPTTHLGPVATAMERRGMKTERGDLNRGCQENRAARAELVNAEEIQAGAERVKAKARTWYIAAQEQARMVAEQERQAKLKAERQEQARMAAAQERQAKLEAERQEQARMAAEQEARKQAAKERLRQEREERSRSYGRMR
jgi:ATP-dependent exoDNAse (exonuclease V) alpha subunit